MGPELDLRPQLERLGRLICWSEDIDEGALSFAFRPLWQLDESAKAALALVKAQATQVYAGLTPQGGGLIFDHQVPTSLNVLRWDFAILRHCMYHSVFQGGRAGVILRYMEKRTELLKIIDSNGGPLVALNRNGLSGWGGIDALLFFQEVLKERNDYDYISFCAGLSSIMHLGKFVGSSGEALYIGYPLPTLIVEGSPNHIFIAQMDGVEPGWSPRELLGSDFEKVVDWRDPFEITLKSGELVFFDAAFVETDLDGDTLSIIIDAGSCRCEWSRQSWEGRADMNFIRIMRQG